MKIDMTKTGVVHGLLDTSVFSKPVYLDENCTIPAPRILSIKNGYIYQNGDVVELYTKD